MLTTSSLADPTRPGRPWQGPARTREYAAADQPCWSSASSSTSGNRRGCPRGHEASRIEVLQCPGALKQRLWRLGDRRRPAGYEVSSAWWWPELSDRPAATYLSDASDVAASRSI